MGVLDVATFYAILLLGVQGCPQKCYFCNPGGGTGGGVNLVEGKCLQHCSEFGYCGTGSDYKTAKGGTDCRGCSVSCPARCSSCKAGGSDLKGVDVVDGKCLNYCSEHNYCGVSLEYKTDGTDCRGCVTCPNSVRILEGLNLQTTKGNRGLVTGCCDSDLNHGAGGTDIYLHAFYTTTYPAGAGLTGTANLLGIKDITLVKGEHTVCPTGYTKLTAENFKNSGDLNDNSGGEYIWLCYKQTADGGNYVTDVKISNSRTCSYGYDRVDFYNEKSNEKWNGDMNKGAGGSDIYLCVKKADCSLPYKTIGRWVHKRQIRSSYDQEITITESFSSIDSNGKSQSNMDSWSSAITTTHEAEVTTEASYESGGATGKVAAKYRYQNEATRTKGFQNTLSREATKTFSQSKVVSKKYKIKGCNPANCISKYSNIWYWRTDAISPELAFASHGETNEGLQVTGCGYDVAPNCLPGTCHAYDNHCWTCTDDQYKIDKNFKAPYCDQNEGCRWHSLKQNECPMNPHSLKKCNQNMKHGQLCESNEYLPNGLKGNANNCDDNSDVYLFKCPGRTASNYKRVTGFCTGTCRAITTPTECEIAAGMLNLPGTKKVMGTHRGAPRLPGCFLYTPGNTLEFNFNMNGKSDHDTTDAICYCDSASQGALALSAAQAIQEYGAEFLNQDWKILLFRIFAILGALATIRYIYGLCNIYSCESVEYQKMPEQKQEEIVI